MKMSVCMLCASSCNCVCVCVSVSVYEGAPLALIAIIEAKGKRLWNGCHRYANGRYVAGVA